MRRLRQSRLSQPPLPLVNPTIVKLGALVVGDIGELPKLLWPLTSQPARVITVPVTAPFYGQDGRRAGDATDKVGHDDGIISGIVQLNVAQ